MLTDRASAAAARSGTFEFVDANEYPPSPVPSDQDLPADELPFTAFGQWGEDRLDLRVFEQDVWWVDRHGSPHLLTRMNQDYLFNVIRHLEVFVLQFFVAVLMKATIEVIYDSVMDVPNGELLSQELGGPRLSDLTPEEWLASTPLMRELRRLLPL